MDIKRKKYKCNIPGVIITIFFAVIVLIFGKNIMQEEKQYHQFIGTWYLVKSNGSEESKSFGSPQCCLRSDDGKTFYTTVLGEEEKDIYNCVKKDGNYYLENAARDKDGYLIGGSTLYEGQIRSENNELIINSNLEKGELLLSKYKEDSLSDEYLYEKAQNYMEGQWQKEHGDYLNGIEYQNALYQYLQPTEQYAYYYLDYKGYSTKKINNYRYEVDIEFDYAQKKTVQYESKFKNNRNHLFIHEAENSVEQDIPYYHCIVTILLDENYDILDYQYEKSKTIY